MIRNLECQFRQSGELFAGLFSLKSSTYPVVRVSCCFKTSPIASGRKNNFASALSASPIGSNCLRIRQSLDLEQILQHHGDRSLSLSATDRVFIGYLDTNNRKAKLSLNQLHPIGSQCWELRSLRLSRGSEGNLYREHPGNRRYDSGRISPAWAEYFHQYQVRASILSPLLGDPFLSVLVAHNALDHATGNHLGDLLKQLAVSIAIQQAELYQQVLTLMPIWNVKSRAYRSATAAKSGTARAKSPQGYFLTCGFHDTDPGDGNVTGVEKIC